VEELQTADIHRMFTGFLDEKSSSPGAQSIPCSDLPSYNSGVCQTGSTVLWRFVSFLAKRVFGKRPQVTEAGADLGAPV
jgi:hypothetical protein